MLGEHDNRRFLASFRLLENEHDSLAWATLLLLCDGIGSSFVRAIYERARDGRVTFGAALLSARADNFADAPRVSANRAVALIDAILAWLAEHPLPEDRVAGWGEWMIPAADGEVVPGPSEQLIELLRALDENAAEIEQTLGRYLGQIWPLGEDRARAESNAVRIMTMGQAKGLTVRATVLMALEDEIIPRPEPPLAEERRLLYVALTRAREFVYGTWARRRTGPTARVAGGGVQDRRTLTRFLRDGPVGSEDGATYLGR
jgi:superfamily I DNA/RNA helicase